MSFDVVFIGETNDGKTTIVSSLMEDEDAVISSTPGTTKVAHCHRLRDREGRTILRAWDTPGFEETDDLHDWFVTETKKMAGGQAQRFIQSHSSDARWDSDIELLKPIAQGALVVYVAASNRKPQSTDLKQLEIVRLAGANRIALINQKPGKDFTKQWNDILKQEIGIVRSYEPLSAGIQQRSELLQKLADCSDEKRDAIMQARQLLQQDWDERLHALTRMMAATIGEVITARGVDRNSKEQAQVKLSQKLRKIEGKFRIKAQQEFKHTNLKFEDEFFDADITSLQFWSMYGLGLSRAKLLIGGAVLGGAVGLKIDVIAGGWFAGLPTATGAAIGGSTAVALASVPFSANRLGDRSYEARIALKSQTCSILLDRMIIFSRCLLQVSHGKRLDEAIRLETTTKGEGGSVSLRMVNQWDGSGIKAFAQLCQSLDKTHGSLLTFEDTQPDALETVLSNIRNSLNDA